jgi:hypothetical protein
MTVTREDDLDRRVRQLCEALASEPDRDPVLLPEDRRP